MKEIWIVEKDNCFKAMMWLGYMKYLGILVLGLMILFSTILVGALTNEQRDEMQKQRIECQNVRVLTNDKCWSDFRSCKTNCTNNMCGRDCFINKTGCIRNMGAEYRNCISLSKISKSKNCINENMSYAAGEIFAKGCDSCSCSENGKIICKKDNFCNKNVSIDEETCAGGGGYYAPLCNGVYFSILCGSEKYCLCGGVYNYGCPKRYECVYDFVSPFKRKGSVNGWKTYLGQSLGDIGVCGAGSNLSRVIE